MDGLSTSLLKELDPLLYKEAFRESANKMVSKTTDKTNEDIENKWNIDIKKLSETKYVAASKVDGKYNKRAGNLHLKFANKGQSNISLYFKGSPINLSRFAESLDIGSYSQFDFGSMKIKKRRKSPRVKILKSKSFRSIDNAFIATMRSGHTGIFIRKKHSKKIVELRTITLPSMLQQVDFDGNLNEVWEKDMNKEFEKNFDTFLKRGYV